MSLCILSLSSAINLGTRIVEVDLLSATAGHSDKFIFFLYTPRETKQRETNNYYFVPES